MLVTVRRGTENKTENITIALNKLMEHPYLHFFAWFQFLCPYFHNSFHVRKKKKKEGLEKMQRKVANTIQGLQQFPY